MAPITSALQALRWLGRAPDRLKPAERRVLERSSQRRTIASDVNERVEAAESFGDRLADSIARIGGSWSFISGFALFLVGWTVANAVLLGAKAFDPYPFIFLNLVLSMLAAVQAPIIMMSQNRSAARDRLDASHDYEVNLKAEIEIMALHEKVDEMRGRDAGELRELLAAIAARLDRMEAALARQ